MHKLGTLLLAGTLLSGSASAATRAADFIASLGVNTHIDFGGSYGNLAQVAASINYLGFKNIRDCVGNSGDLASWTTVANATGAKFDAYIGEVSQAGMTQEMNLLPPFAQAGLLASVEGGNEEDDSYPASLGNTVAAAASFQQQIYAMGQSLGLPVVNLSFGAGWTPANNWAGDYDKVGDLSAYATYGNAHTYPNAPGGFVDSAVQRLNSLARMAAKSRPVITTEIGWDHNQSGFDRATVAKLALNAAFDGLKNGNPKTYYYALYDDGSGAFGLMNGGDGSPYPAGAALHNLTALLADTGTAATTFAPGGLTAAATGGGTNALALQKSDGTYWIVVWNEATGRSYPYAVTVSLSRAADSVAVYDPMQSTAAIGSLPAGKTVQVSVPDHPVMLRVTVPVAPVPAPAPTPLPTPPPAPPPLPPPGPTPACPTAAPTPVPFPNGPQIMVPCAPPTYRAGAAPSSVTGVFVEDPYFAAMAPSASGALVLGVDFGTLSFNGPDGVTHAVTSAQGYTLGANLGGIEGALASLVYSASTAGTAHIGVKVVSPKGAEGSATLTLKVQ